MKTRILGNSIRFRVSMDEMEQLSLGKSIVANTDFLSGSLKVSIVSWSNSHQIDYDQNTIELRLNKVELEKLHISETIGFSFDVKKLQVLFEKDFKCLTDRGEDEAKLYKNPRLEH